MKNLRIILMSIMTMFMIIGNVNSQEFNIDNVDIVWDGFSYNGSSTSTFTRTSTYESYIKFTISSDKLGDFGNNVNVTFDFRIGIFGDVENEGSDYKIDINGVEVSVDKTELDYTWNESYEYGVYEGNVKVTIEDVNATDGIEVKISSESGFEGEEVNYRGITITDKSLSVSENDISNDFNVYTHNNNLIVKTDDYNTQYEVSVHNMNGQMVMSEKNNGQMETYLQVPNGIYIINLITEDGGRLTKKVSIR